MASPAVSNLAIEILASRLRSAEISADNFRWANAAKIRSCQFLNNIVEQDHRRIKARVQPMLGFKKFYNARRVLIGIEFMQKIHKGQYNLAGA